jgi:large subunit ribosomal protein L44e
MKLPRKTKRFCPHCNEHTEHKIDLVSTGHKRGTLKWGSLTRAKLRHAFPGMGNKGRSSRKAIKSWKRKTKTTMRRVLMYTCQTCKKSKMSPKSHRVSKVEII